MVRGPLDLAGMTLEMLLVLVGHQPPADKILTHRRAVPVKNWKNRAPSCLIILEGDYSKPSVLGQVAHIPNTI